MDENGKLRKCIFDENVRAFLGENNPVNTAIEETINNGESQNRFAILNNGITIISPDVKNMGTHIAISDYQIVNGCQTSTVLFNNYSKLHDSTFVTLRIVQVEKTDVISEVVRATNSQTKVDDTQFLSFTTLFRRIEQYFESTEDSADDEIRLFLERRINQYKEADIPKNRIYKIQDVCRAVESMFFDRPAEAGRNPSKLIKDDIGRLSNPKNKEVAYYAATLALYRINLLVHKGRILNDYAIYRWQILMILKYILCDGSLPKITNKKSCETFSKKVIKICTQTDEESKGVFEEAISVINEIGKENRDIVRTPAYTHKIVEYCREKYLKGTD